MRWDIWDHQLASAVVATSCDDLFSQGAVVIDGRPRAIFRKRFSVRATRSKVVKICSPEAGSNVKRCNGKRVGGLHRSVSGRLAPPQRASQAAGFDGAVLYPRFSYFPNYRTPSFSSAACSTWNIYTPYPKRTRSHVLVFAFVACSTWNILTKISDGCRIHQAPQAIGQ